MDVLKEAFDTGFCKSRTVSQFEIFIYKAVANSYLYIAMPLYFKCTVNH